MGEPEYIMCAAIYFDDGEDYLYKPYNIDKGVSLLWLETPVYLKQCLKSINHDQYKVF